MVQTVNPITRSNISRILWRIFLIRLSEKKIWGKLAASMVTEEGGALYILDRSNDILMAYNEKYKKQLKELKEQEIVKEISEMKL